MIGRPVDETRRLLTALETSINGNFDALLADGAGNEDAPFRRRA